MAAKPFSRRGLLLRFMAAAVLVFVTYNPEGYSFYDWALTEPLMLDHPKLAAGMSLIIAWTAFLTLAYRPPGTWVTILVTVILGALIWALLYYRLVTPDSPRTLSYLIMLALCVVLAVGCYWSHIWHALRARRKAHQLKDRARSAV